MNVALLLVSCWIFHSPEHIYEGPSGVLSGRVDGLNHMAPVKSHAEPGEITSDKGAGSLPLTGFYVWNETLNTDT